MNGLIRDAVSGLREALAVIGLAALAVAFATPHIGDENADAAYRAMLGAYLAVRVGWAVAAALKTLREAE